MSVKLQTTFSDSIQIFEQLSSNVFNVWMKQVEENTKKQEDSMKQKTSLV